MAGRRKKRPEELMVTFTVRMPPELKKELKKKARPAALSTVIRRLVEMYVNGEVHIDWTEEDNGEEEEES